MSEDDAHLVVPSDPCDPGSSVQRMLTAEDFHLWNGGGPSANHVNGRKMLRMMSFAPPHPQAHDDKVRWGLLGACGPESVSEPIASRNPIYPVERRPSSTPDSPVTVVHVEHRGTSNTERGRDQGSKYWEPRNASWGVGALHGFTGTKQSMRDLT